eukprot:GHVU01066061.1.p1 GENE.GHVU01066061.1~~GHVU01066061.1.p1  ORF type:complete len:144 (+),score=6.43 GHVU01066061.1:51-434(+)
MAAFKSSVNLAQLKWRAKGSPTSFIERNDIQLYGDSAEGQIDINEAGWPAQSWPGVDTVLDLDNVNDCISVWTALLDISTGTIDSDASADYQAAYLGSNDCSYVLNSKIDFGFEYDSKNGQVTRITP